MLQRIILCIKSLFKRIGNEKTNEENENGRAEINGEGSQEDGKQKASSNDEEKGSKESLQVNGVFMITREEILMDRDKEYPLTPELEANLEALLKAVNAIRAAYGKPLRISSGYRPGAYNTAAGGAKRSNHMVCKAVDFRDPNGEIDKWCDENQDLLESLGLWQEHPSATKGWCHLDISVRAIKDRPGCKKRQFKP